MRTHWQYLAALSDDEERLGAAGDGGRLQRGHGLDQERRFDFRALEAAQLVLVVQSPHEDARGAGGRSAGRRARPRRHRHHVRLLEHRVVLLLWSGQRRQSHS